MASKDDLIAHVFRLVGVVRSAKLKRTLEAVDPEPRLNFWRLIYGHLLDVAVLEWCKVFGVHSEPTHWKHVISDHDAFRKELLDALKINENEWGSYWEVMKNYRDELVAHHIRNGEVTHYPDLNIALESAYFYYTYLIKELRSQGEARFPDDLKVYGQSFEEQAIEIAKVVLAATSNMPEKVY